MLRRGEQAPRFGVGRRDDGVDADHRVRCGELRRRPKLRAIQRERRVELVRREMRRERVRQAERGGELRAVQARAQDPQRHLEPRSGHGLHGLVRPQRAEQRLQLEHVVGERVGARVIAAQRAQREHVGARRAAEAEIDAAGVERLERAELLGDHERRMVRQHDAAGADANRARPAGDVADHDRRRGARDADHVVMLGEPEPPVTPTLGVLRELERALERRRPAWRPRERRRDRGSTARPATSARR